jgi:hypothetical protein
MPPKTAGGVIVREIPNLDGMALRVQRVGLSAEGDWIAVGEIRDMPTYCFMPAGAWEIVRLPEGNPHRMGDVQETCFIGGAEVVKLTLPMIPTVVSGDEPHRGCRPGVPE